MAEPARPAPTDDGTTAFVEAVHEGVVAANADRAVPCKTVRRWLLSWHIKVKLPPPQVDLVEALTALRNGRALSAAE